MIAIINNFTAWTWGAGTNGRLGDQTTANKSSPVAVVGGHSFIQVALGRSSNCYGLKADGTVWSWGNGTAGSLGDNTTTAKSSPVLIVGSHSFVQISAGNTHVVALKADGSVWCWGAGLSGQLGDNASSNRSSPVSVVGGHSFIEVSAGNAHSIGLKANGEVWCWGSGTNGRLGNNDAAAQSSPVLVVGNHSFVQVAAGSNNTYGRKANGEIWCWGRGLGGELGNNDNTSNQSSPVSVIGGHSFIFVGGGNGNCYALKSDGSAWAWGDATNGSLGDSTTTAKSSPVSVVGSHSFTQIYRGTGQNAYALKANGSVWCWGLGTSGELGDNTTTSKSSPVSVVGGFNFKAIPDNSFTGSFTTEDNSDTLEISDTIQVDDTIVMETDTLEISDTIQLDDVGEENISDTILISDTIELEDTAARFATKIISVNPLIFVTDTNPAKIVLVDTTDPENITWTIYTLTSTTNAVDFSYNSNTGFIYVACADGKVKKVDFNNFNTQSIIDVSDTDDLLTLDLIEADGVVYAGTENNVGEMYTLDERDTFIIDANIAILAEDFFRIDAQFDAINAFVIDANIAVIGETNFIIPGNFSCLTLDAEEVENIVPIRPIDFHVYIDDVELEDTDVDLNSVRITHTIDEKSTAEFKLTRRHDNPNNTIQGNASTITNKNGVKVYILGELEFEGKISDLDCQYNSDGELIMVVATGTKRYTSFSKVLLSLPGLNERRNLYQITVQNPRITNPDIDANDPNPFKYKGVRVNLGTKVEQQVTRIDEFDPLGRNADKITAGTFIPRQNWTYFWGATVINPKFFFTGLNGDLSPVKNPPNKPEDTPFHAIELPVFSISEAQFPGTQATGETSMIVFNYIGTSLTPVSSEIWQLKHAPFRRQREYPDTSIKLGSGSVTTPEIQSALDNINSDDDASAIGAELQSKGFTSGGVITQKFKLTQSATELGLSSTRHWTEIYELLENNLGYTVGEAPFKDVATRNGQLVTKYKWSDEKNGLYSIKEASYNFVEFAKRVAELEYQKLSNINGDILPDTSANIQLTVDAYKYYGLTLLNRVNVDNTTSPGVYKDNNGFPLSIKSITISSADCKVNLQCDNAKSTEELRLIDGQFPDENDPAFNDEEKRILIDLKSDMRTRLKVE